MNTNRHTPSPFAQQALAVMKQAVSKELDRKKRLGHYAVIWKDGKPVKIGEDVSEH